MDGQDDADREPDLSTPGNTSASGEHQSHASMGGAAAAGAVTGGVIGLTGGPIGAAIGALGGAIVGAAAERMMHSDDDVERAHAASPSQHVSGTLEQPVHPDRDTAE